METVSPTKRRAALATLDANAKPTLSSSPKMMMPLKDGAATASAIPRTGGISPLKKSVAGDATGVLGGTKRSAEAAETSPSGKKTCMEPEEDTRRQRSRTTSPDTSSVFDSSTGDASWATAATELDLADRIMANAPAVLFTQRGNMTREQAREKAEILRLRLGLASYKVRTGQTAIPLADLQAKPLPPHRYARVQSPNTSQSDCESQHQQEEQHAASPQASQQSAVTCSSQQSCSSVADTDAPAASGLLSLAMGNPLTT